MKLVFRYYTVWLALSFAILAMEMAAMEFELSSRFWWLVSRAFLPVQRFFAVKLNVEFGNIPGVFLCFALTAALCAFAIVGVLIPLGWLFNRKRNAKNTDEVVANYEE